jgi:hypothetical protein
LFFVRVLDFVFAHRMGLGDEAEDEAIRDAKVMHARLLRSRVPSGAVQSTVHQLHVTFLMLCL